MPLLLAGYAVAVAAAGTWWLPRASWPQRAPRLAIAVWQALTVTVVASALLAGLLLTVPCLRGWADWSSLRDCLLSVRAQYTSPGGALASTDGCGPHPGRGGPAGLVHRDGGDQLPARPRPT